VEEVTRYIKPDIERELWAKAAGRCEFDGCNLLLYKSPITQEIIHLAEKAHIYSFSKKGPRGWGILKNRPKDLNNVENLMLMCNHCHLTIDNDKKGEMYSANLLQQWKKEHEQRIAIVTGITSDKKTHVVFYESNIGEQNSRIQKQEAFAAIFPERYPAEANPLLLSMAWSNQDHTPAFWAAEDENLKTCFNSEITAKIIRQPTETSYHFTLFSFAPMPLLIRLGTLFTDKIEVDVRQPIREPKTWRWQEMPEDFEFFVNEPANTEHPPVLLISLSDKVKHQRVFDVLGPDVSVWELTADSKFLNNNIIVAKEQLSLFRTEVRKLMNRIRQTHGVTTPLSIFPIMPISCSVELGRVRMPKVEMPWIIYDHNRVQEKFVETIRIGGEAQ